jgi:hypothetical protein
MITLDLSILNQKGTPMFNSDIFSNRPAAGVVGRIFISTDTYEFYRDTGSAWDLIGGSGTGTVTGSGTIGTLPIWTGSSVLGDSTLLEGATKFTTTKDFQADGYYLTGMTGGSGALYWTSDRVTLANYNVGGIVHIEVNGGIASTIFGTDLSLTNYGYIAATPTLTAANNASSLASYGINTLSYSAGFSSNNIGALYGGIAGFNLQTFAGSATFAQANVASGGASVNSIDFSSAGSTITMTQAAGIRVMSGQQNLFQYQGTNSGTITHAAISQNTGFYRPTAASGILTITNAYSLLLNALDDYGAGFSFTNRWGIYQAGASDKNYFAANMLLGSTTDNGHKLQVTGQSYFSSNVGIGISPFGRLTSSETVNNGTANVLYLSNPSQTGVTSAAINFVNADAVIKSSIIAAVYGNDYMSFNVNSNTERARISAAGNFLIGTTTDNGEKLQVNGGTRTGGIVITGNTALPAQTSTFLWMASGFSSPVLGKIYIGDGTGWRLNFSKRISSTDTDLITMVDNGNLLINTTTDNGQKLQLNGSFRIDGQTSGSAGGNSGQHLIINCDGTTYKIALLNP